MGVQQAVVAPGRLGSLAIVFVFGGMASASQSRANGEFTLYTGSGVHSAFISFVIGLGILSVVALGSGSIRRGIAAIPRAVRAGTLPIWAVPAGVLGGVFIACASYSVALIGVSLFAVGTVMAQTSTALAVDRIGLGPTGRTRLSANRIVAASLAIVAVLIAAAPSITAADFAILAVLASILGGVATTVQQGLNGRITVAAKQPIATTWLNFLFGSLGLLIGLLFAMAFLGDTFTWPSSGPWWMWLGGVFGVVFILTSAWAVPRLGVLVTMLSVIAGQLTGALVYDLLLPVGDNTLTWQIVAGVLLTFVAVYLGSMRRPGQVLR